MCDTVAGELLLCFPKIDEAARRLVMRLRDRVVDHVEYLDSLEDRLYRVGLEPDVNLEFELHRVRVPEGQESWKTTYLNFFYKQEVFQVLAKSSENFAELHSRSDYQYTVAPNHVLSLSAAPGANAISAANFKFGASHAQFKNSIGLASPLKSGSDKIRVLLL